MILFANLNKKTIIITEDQQKSIYYDRFQQSQSFRFSVVAKLAEMGYVFHGSNEEFDSFEQSKIKGGNRGVYGYGAYFTDAAYKCEEFGNNFQILNISSFNILDTAQPASTLLNIPQVKNIFEIPIQIHKINYELDNVRNVREYEHYNKMLENLKKIYSMYDSEFIDKMIYFTENNKNRSIDNIRKTIEGSSISDKGYDKMFSDFFLSIGYDGFKNGVEYVIFNFEKLNQNLVKDKEKLIMSIMN